LSDDHVIEFISRNFVPVAQNLYVIREEKGPAGDFFRSIQKQRPNQYQGLYIVTAAGEVLASHQQFTSDKTWTNEVLADLKPGLKVFGEVKPRDAKVHDPLPHRGMGVRTDGGVVLAVYLRYSIKGVPLREVPDSTIDSLPLSAEEWAKWAPAKPDAGVTWTVPEGVARKFSRVLGPSDEDSMPRPKEVRSVQFNGKVQSVEDGVAYLTYEGHIKGSHETQSNKGKCHGEAKLTGVGSYDVKNGRMLSLTLVFDGVFRNVKPYDQPAKYSGVAEWRRERERK
jgi:hypothetical protein